MNKKIIIAIAIAILAIGGLVAYKSYRSDTSYRTYTTDTSDTTDLQSSAAAARYVNKRYGFSFDKPEGYTVGVLTEGEGEMILVQLNRSDTTDTTHTTDTSYKSYTSDRSQSGFQIFVNQLDQSLELTPQFIKSDLLGTAVNNPRAIELDGKAKGIMFDSNSEAFGGKSFEIWFVAPKAPRINTNESAQMNTDITYLYQISSYAEFSEQLKAIIGTWRFSATTN